MSTYLPGIVEGNVAYLINNRFIVCTVDLSAANQPQCEFDPFQAPEGTPDPTAFTKDPSGLFYASFTLKGPNGEVIQSLLLNSGPDKIMGKADGNEIIALGGFNPADKFVLYYGLDNGVIYRSDDFSAAPYDFGAQMNSPFNPADGDTVVLSGAQDNSGIWIGRGKTAFFFNKDNTATQREDFKAPINAILAIDKNNAYFSLKGSGTDAVVLHVYDQGDGVFSDVVLNSSVDAILKVTPTKSYFWKNNQLLITNASCANRDQDPATNCFTCLDKTRLFPACAPPQPPPPPPQECSWDWDCDNDACGREHNTDKKVCCPTGQTSSYFGFDWCSGYEDGEVCRHDGQCKSEVCLNNRCGKGKVDPVTTCSWDYECENHHCGREGNVDKKVCCKNGEHCSPFYSPFDWCSGYGPGETCEKNCQCTSDYCSTIEYNGVSYSQCMCTENAIGTFNLMCIKDAFYGIINGDTYLIIRWVSEIVIGSAAYNNPIVYVDDVEHRPVPNKALDWNNYYSDRDDYGTIFATFLKVTDVRNANVAVGRDGFSAGLQKSLSVSVEGKIRDPLPDWATTLPKR
jgi:hypothetical protein